MMIRPLLLGFALITGCTSHNPLAQSTIDGQWLEVRFVQEGKELASSVEDGITTIRLSKPKFEIMLPAGDKAIQICAGSSVEIFRLSSHDNSTCFAPGSGMALPKQPPESGWPLLLSTGYGHNYYDSSRTVSIDKERAVVIRGMRGKVPTSKVFLTLYVDKNGNKIVEREEYKRFILEFFDGDAIRGSKEGLVRSRTDKEIQTVFSDNKQELYQLYLDELKRTPGLSGKLVLRLTILPTGEVRDPSVHSSTLGSKVLEKKILERIAEFNFGAAYVRKVTIIYPIDFITTTSN